MNLSTWYRLVGVRPCETKTVGLLLLHSFLLGLGTILVFVVATVLLLESQPARSLPLAYGAGGLAMLGVGRLYAYWERRGRLPQLVVRARLAALVLLTVLGVLVLLGPSVAAAVSVMAGYRLIYLLTSLELRGLGATVLSARQGRRLFGFISAGDLPAKVLGAMLAIFAHVRYDLYLLLLTAFGAYLLAWYVQRRALAEPPTGARPGLLATTPPADLPHSAEGRKLVIWLGLSLTTIAVVATGAEYLLLIKAWASRPDYATVLRYGGGGLALTYLLTIGLRLLAARRGFDRLSVRRMLLLLPLAALAGVLLFAALKAAGLGPRGQLWYFGGLCLGLEVLRRTLFEPALLVLLQPLPPLRHLRGYTAVKSIYEPLGLGLGGLLLLALPPGAGWPAWLPLAWMGLALGLAVLLLQGAYQQYLTELKKVLGLPREVPAGALTTPPVPAGGPPASALNALLHLHRADAPTLVRHAEALLHHPESKVRSRTLTIVGEQLSPALLRHLTLHDANAGVRALASRLAGRHPDNTDLLAHPDMVVRKGAIRGRLEAVPADAAAQASLAAVVANDSHHLTALELIGFLNPDQQVACIVRGLRSPDPALVQAAVLASAAVAPEVLVGPLIGLLPRKATRKGATDSLARLGDATLPHLREVMVRETDERLVRHLAQVCARLGTPASRQLLLQLAQDANLSGRAAALNSLSSLPAVPTDAPLFQHLVEEELRLAQHLLHSMMTANVELRTALRYELRRTQQRLLGVLMQLYERAPLLAARRALAPAVGERPANALEPLENLVPRPLYLGLQALLNEGRLREKVQIFDDLLGPAIQPEPIQTTIVRRGAAAFTAWTVGVALRQWHPEPATVSHLYPHLQTADPLIQESAVALLRRLPTQRPAAYDQLLAEYPTLATFPAMPDPTAASPVPFVERVRILKSTALFGQTPENILGTIVPIMHEVTFGQDEEIFAKDTLGTSLFIICEGEVGIFNKGQLLTTFGKGEFFGELALLDAEPRSASAVARQPVRAFRIDQEDFYDVTEECPEVMRSIMRELCQRLRRQNEKMPQPATEPVAH